MRRLVKKTELKEAEIPRRLVVICLKNVKDLADLLKAQPSELLSLCAHFHQKMSNK